MPYRYSPLGNFFQFVLCLALCDALTRPRVVRAYPPGTTVYYASEAPEPAPLPALALEVPPKAEVVERV